MPIHATVRRAPDSHKESQDQQPGPSFFIVEAQYAGQGLSFSKWKVRLLEGQWPHSSKLAVYLDEAYFGGAYQWETLDTATFYANRD